MTLRHRLKIIVVAAALITTSCSTPTGLGNSFIAYNEGVARATDQLFVLNAVRAAERKQVVYTRFSALRGQATGSVSANLPIPFGPKSPDNFTLTPTLSVSGTPSFDVAVLDDQEFWRGITTPIDGATLQYFLDQNWSPDLLGHLLFEEIRFQDSSYRSLVKFSDVVCTATDIAVSLKTLAQSQPPISQETRARCGFLRAVLERRQTACKARAAESSTNRRVEEEKTQEQQPYYKRQRVKLKDGKPVGTIEELVFDNRPDAPCVMSGFQEVLTRQLVLMLHMAKVPKKTPASPTFWRLPTTGLDGSYIGAASKAATENFTIKTKNGYRLERNSSDAKFFVLKLSTTDAMRIDQLDRTLFEERIDAITPVVLRQRFGVLERIIKKASFESAGEIEGTIVMRSPNAIVYYLGEVIRAKFSHAPQHDWTHPGEALAYRHNLTGDAVHLFDIEEGGSPDDGTVVLDYDDHTFWLPTSADNRGHQVIAFLGQLFNLYKKADKAPATQAVTVIGQ